MLDFQFNENIIGYSYVDEAKTICNLINEIKCDDILEVGCFTGKLTWSLCKTFPNKQIVALDIWDHFMDKLLDPSIHISGSDMSLFKSFNHEHTNLMAIQGDFLQFNLIHDVVILGADNLKLDWKKHIDHALALSPKLIIGRHAYEHNDKRNALRSIIKTYNHTFYNHGIYTIHI